MFTRGRAHESWETIDAYYGGGTGSPFMKAEEKLVNFVCETRFETCLRLSTQ
jgi:hypothetical protein